MRFKRNQVEEAISRTTFPEDRSPGTDLRTKLKRLLDTDRALGRNARSSDPEQSNYAFFSGDAPGSGVEVWYSPYEAFALHVAFQLLVYGCPQSLAVTIARVARPKLEPLHPKLLARNPAEGAIFLIVVARRKRDEVTREIHVFGQAQLNEFLSRHRVGYVTQIDITHAVRLLQRHLEDASPSKRGRAN
jgi:hypothetical protein